MVFCRLVILFIPNECVSVNRILEFLFYRNDSAPRRYVNTHNSVSAFTGDWRMKVLGYQFRRLYSDNEFLDYNKSYLQNGGDQSIPLSWMRDSKVIGVYESGRLVGGYVECCPPIRSTADIPDEIREKILTEQCGNLNNVQENAAFWISRNTSSKGLLQSLVWLSIALRSVFATRCTYTLGVSNRKPIAKLYKMLCGKVIYQAPSKLIEGEQYHVFLWSKFQLFSIGFQIINRFLKNLFSFKRRKAVSKG